MSESTSSSQDTSHLNQALIDGFVKAGHKEAAARIMAAALQLFAKKGYTATTVREIVREADVTNPMLYYYFDSKEGVFSTLLEVLFESVAETVEEIIDHHSGLRCQLREITRAYFEGCRDTPQVLRFIYSVLFGPEQSRPTYEPPEAHRRVVTMIETLIREAIDDGEFRAHPEFDPRYLTERFMGLVDNHLMGVFGLQAHEGYYIEGRDTIDDFLGDEAIEEMLDFFFYGAGAFVGEEDR